MLISHPTGRDVRVGNGTLQEIDLSKSSTDASDPGPTGRKNPWQATVVNIEGRNTTISIKPNNATMVGKWRQVWCFSLMSEYLRYSDN